MTQFRRQSNQVNQQFTKLTRALSSSRKSNQVSQLPRILNITLTAILCAVVSGSTEKAKVDQWEIRGVGKMVDDLVREGKSNKLKAYVGATVLTGGALPILQSVSKYALKGGQRVRSIFRRWECSNPNCRAKYTKKEAGPKGKPAELVSDCLPCGAIIDGKPCGHALERNDRAKQFVKRGNFYARVGDRWVCSETPGKGGCGKTYSKNKARICVGGPDCRTGYSLRTQTYKKTCTKQTTGKDLHGKRLIPSHKFPQEQRPFKKHHYTFEVAIDEMFKNFTCSCRKKGTLVRNDKWYKAAVKKLKEAAEVIKNIPEKVQKVLKKYRCKTCKEVYSKTEANQKRATDFMTYDNTTNAYTCLGTKAAPHEGTILLRNNKNRKAVKKFFRVANRWCATMWLCTICKETYSEKEAITLDRKCCEKYLEQNQITHNDSKPADAEDANVQRHRKPGLENNLSSKRLMDDHSQRRRLLASAERAGAVKISDHLLARMSC